MNGHPEWQSAVSKATQLSNKHSRWRDLKRFRDGMSEDWGARQNGYKVVEYFYVPQSVVAGLVDEEIASLEAELTEAGKAFTAVMGFIND